MLSFNYFCNLGTTNRSVFHNFGLLSCFCISGDTLGSIVYVPCEVIKQRMQVQGTKTSWTQATMKSNVHVKSGRQMYGYYTSMFQAARSILKEQGPKGLYTG